MELPTVMGTTMAAWMVVASWGKPMSSLQYSTRIDPSAMVSCVA